MGNLLETLAGLFSLDPVRSFDAQQGLQRGMVDWAKGVGQRAGGALEPGRYPQGGQQFKNALLELIGVNPQTGAYDHLPGFGIGGVSAAKGAAPMDAAIEQARINAAKPIAEGGLGLPPNNTAMDRARAMGFDTDLRLYHGTADDIPAFDPASHGGRVSNSKVGLAGVSAADNPAIASEFSQQAGISRAGQEAKSGQNILPLYHRATRGASIGLSDDAQNMEVLGTVLDAWDDGFDGLRLTNYSTPSKSKIGPAYIVKNPNQLRSIFAAFDPAKRNSADLLAGLAAGAVPASLLYALSQRGIEDGRD